MHTSIDNAPDGSAPLLTYTLRLGDAALVCGQRLIERVTHGPELEEELANANLALDYIGQARLFFSYAGELEGGGRTEDDFAFRRPDNAFQNVLLVEQADRHFGDTVVRQLLFVVFYEMQLKALTGCTDSRLAEIAVRALREIRYHRRHLSQWLVRLGDGTEESHQRVQESLDRLWGYTAELFDGDDVDTAIQDSVAGPDLSVIRGRWSATLEALCAEATLKIPTGARLPGGGRQGLHSEAFSYLVGEMQQLTRRYPNSAW